MMVVYEGGIVCGAGCLAICSVDALVKGEAVGDGYRGIE